MTPTTPIGWYSSVHFWLMETSPGKTLRGPSTFCACLVAQSRWVIAAIVSSWASASGLPVSSWISSATRPRERVSEPLKLSSRSRRSFQPSARHQWAASLARSTAARTACSSWTGCLPTTSPVAGLRDSNVSRSASIATDIADLPGGIALSWLRWLSSKPPDLLGYPATAGSTPPAARPPPCGSGADGPPELEQLTAQLDPARADPERVGEVEHGVEEGAIDWRHPQQRDQDEKRVAADPIRLRHPVPWQVWLDDAEPVKPRDRDQVEQRRRDLQEGQEVDPRPKDPVTERGELVGRSDAGDDEGERDREQRVGDRPGRRDQAVPQPAGDRPAVDPDGASRQADAPDQDEQHRDEEAQRDVGVLAWVQGEVAAGGDAVVAGAVGEVGMAEIVQAQRDDPAGHDETEQREAGGELVRLRAVPPGDEAA